MIRAVVSLLALSSIALVSLASNSVFDLGEPVLKAAVFEKFYVPAGFDSNDHVQIVGEGMFKNTCYRPAPATAQVDPTTKTIYVGPVAYEYPGLCLQVILPFDRVIDVGVLSSGVWRVIQNDDPSVIGEVQIAPALVDTPDSFHYASVSQAFFRQKGLDGEILISGTHLNTCMTLDEVKVTLEKDVLVLQPIVKMENRSDCRNELTPFTTVVKVDLIPAGRYLLHVRSVNGNAINSLFEVR